MSVLYITLVSKGRWRWEWADQWAWPNGNESHLNGKRNE